MLACGSRRCYTRQDTIRTGPDTSNKELNLFCTRLVVCSAQRRFRQLHDLMNVTLTTAPEAGLAKTPVNTPQAHITIG
jgi:hypothetical protein